MAVTKFLYPIDLTGTASSNRIEDEVHVLGKQRYRATALNFGPFFADSLVIMDTQNNRRLTRGFDYECLYTIPELVKATRGQEVTGVVIVTNSNVSTDIKVSYNIVGGHYSANVYVISKAIEDLERDNRNVYWKDVLEKTELFDPAPHSHDIGDTYGFEYIISMLSSIDTTMSNAGGNTTEAIRIIIREAVEGIQNQLNVHLGDEGNPHALTAAQINAYTRQQVDALITNLAEQLDDVEPKIAQNLRLIQSLTSEVASVKTGVSSQGVRLGAIERVQSNISMNISELNDSVTATDGELLKMQKEVELLHAQDTELGDSIENLIQRDLTHDSEIDQLTASLNSLTSTVTSIGNRVSALEKNLATTNANVGNNDRDIQNLQNAVSSPQIQHITGGNALSGLTAGKRYMVHVSGITNEAGNGDTTYRSILVFDSSDNRLLARAHGDAWINWPDGNVPINGCVIITAPSSGRIYAKVNLARCSSMFAIRLN